MSSDESSSSEEDVPLAALKNDDRSKDSHNRRRSASSAVVSYREDSEEEEYEFQSDNDLRKHQGNNKDDDDDDDDDDKPIASLKRKANTREKQKTSSTTAKKVKPAAKTSKASTTKKTISKSESNISSSSVSKVSSSSALVTPASELYAKSTKGKLISELLCRWWYAFSWPDPSVVKSVPPNCDVLDGFPGVFVVTSGEEIGKIMDNRDPSTCPCFSNMVKKSSEELKELLLKAIEEQTKILIQHEGPGTRIEKDLMALKKWATKVNPKSAEKEAEKVLKAANLKLF